MFSIQFSSTSLWWISSCRE